MKDSDGKPIYSRSSLRVYVDDGPDSPAGVAHALQQQGSTRSDIAGQLALRFGLDLRLNQVTELINLYKETP